MPPDAQAKASQMAGMAGPVKSVGANPVPVTLAVVNNEKEAVGFSEGVAQAASPASSPSVPMLCSIFSSQVWRAAGLEPKAVGTRLLVHQEEQREAEEERAREEKAEAERRRAERAAKARRARAAKSQATPKGLRERALAIFGQAEKKRAEEAEAEAEEAARASRAATAQQAEPSQSKEAASSLVRAEAPAPLGKEDGLGRGGETPAAQKAAEAGPSSANPTSPLRRKPPDRATAGANNDTTTNASGLSSDPSAESSGEEGRPTPPKSPPRVGSKPKSPSQAVGRPEGKLPAAATPGLDDEQLAMLLHQELNAPASRRRRGRDASGATPQPEDMPSPKRRRGPGVSSPNSPLSPVARRGRTAGAEAGGEKDQAEDETAKPVDLSAPLALHA